MSSVALYDNINTTFRYIRFNHNQIKYAALSNTKTTNRKTH